MIELAAGLAGAAWGAWRARSRGGNRLDMAQYGVAHAILFALVALFARLALVALL